MFTAYSYSLKITSFTSDIPSSTSIICIVFSGTTSHQKSLASNQNWEVTADSDDCLIVDDMNDTDEEPTQPTNRCLEVSAVIDIVDDLR